MVNRIWQQILKKKKKDIAVNSTSYYYYISKQLKMLTWSLSVQPHHKKKKKDLRGTAICEYM